MATPLMTAGLLFLAQVVAPAPAPIPAATRDALVTDELAARAEALTYQLQLIWREAPELRDAERRVEIFVDGSRQWAGPSSELTPSLLVGTMAATRRDRPRVACVRTVTTPRLDGERIIDGYDAMECIGLGSPVSDSVPAGR